MSSPVRRWAGRAFLRLFGWRVEGRAPDELRCVVIAAPHTSIWDLPLTLAVAFALDVRPSWMGKHTLFRPPFGALLRRMGGVPIERHLRKHMVQQMIDRMRDSESLVLAVPPEATRSRAPHWRSGFYHIARGAGVPIVLGYLDYARKRGGVGPTLWPTGDLHADMDRIRDFYADKVGRFPEHVGPIHVLDEEEPMRAAR